MRSFSFGDSPEMADELLNLVLSGQKTATSWAVAHGTQENGVGHRSTILDSKGRQRVVIETTELTRKLFSNVDDSFAHDEGEGDLSLEYWRKEHERYFKAEGTFSPSMEVYCQRFKVIEVLN